MSWSKMGHHSILRRGCLSRTLRGAGIWGLVQSWGTTLCQLGTRLSYPGALCLDGFDMQTVLHGVAGASGLHTVLRSPAAWLGTGLTVAILLEQWGTEVHIIALLLSDMGIWSMDRLHMLAEGAGVCVPLGAARDLADVGFLGGESGLGYEWGPKDKL